MIISLFPFLCLLSSLFVVQTCPKNLVWSSVMPCTMAMYYCVLMAALLEGIDQFNPEQEEWPQYVE